MRLRKMFLPLTIAVVMVVMAACGSGSGSSVDPLIGLWVDEYGNFLEFFEDGTAINISTLGYEEISDWERIDDSRIRFHDIRGNEMVIDVSVSDNSLTARSGGQTAIWTRQKD